MSTEAVGGWTYEFSIGDRLRVAREHAGYDQRRFEEVTGISRATIYNYERGKTKPRRAYITEWALATGANREWLETGTSAPKDDDGCAARESNPQPAGKCIILPFAA